MQILQTRYRTPIQDDPVALVPTVPFEFLRAPQNGHAIPSRLPKGTFGEQNGRMHLTLLRAEIERRRRQIERQRKEIRDLQRAGIPTKSAEELLARMLSQVDALCADRDQLVGEQRIEYPQWLARLYPDGGCTVGIAADALQARNVAGKKPTSDVSTYSRHLRSLGLLRIEQKGEAGRVFQVGTVIIATDK
jgi:hypothetical protein